jgi:hypothetical protein
VATTTLIFFTIVPRFDRIKPLLTQLPIVKANVCPNFLFKAQKGNHEPAASIATN